VDVGGVAGINGQLLRYCDMPEVSVVGQRNWWKRASLSRNIFNQVIHVRASVVVGWPIWLWPAPASST
jgi:hypothetical protein